MQTHPSTLLRRTSVIAALAVCVAMVPGPTSEAQRSDRGSSARGTASAPKSSGTAARGGSATRARASTRATSTAAGRAATKATRSAPSRASGRATYGHGYRYGYRYGYPYASGHGHRWYGHGYYYDWPWYVGASVAWGWPAYAAYGYAYPRTVIVDGREPDGLPVIVETDITPKRATVVVNGETVGQARDFNGRWDSLDLMPGTHVFEFSADGMMTLRRVIRARGGTSVVIEARLRGGDGLDPRSDPLPEPEPPAARAPADAAPIVGRDGHRETPPTLSTGLLRLDVAPADAAVYLDGEFLAHAGELSKLHGALPVARGRHTLEVVRPGFEPYRTEIDVDDTTPRTVEVRLRRGR